jgi:integrase
VSGVLTALQTTPVTAPDDDPAIAALVAALTAKVTAQVRAELAAERKPQAKPPVGRTFAELWDEYFPTIRNKNTRSNAESARRKFDLKFRFQGKTVTLAGARTEELTKAFLRAWVDALCTLKTRAGEALKPGSVDVIRAAAQSCLALFVEREELTHQPFAGIPFLQSREGSPGRLGYFTEEQLAEYKAHCHPTLWDVLWTSSRCGGLRVQEALGLTKDQINFETREMWIRRKGGRVTTAVIPSDVLEMLRRRVEAAPGDYVFPNPRDPRGGPLSRFTLNGWNRRAREKWGVKLLGEKPVPHHARHTKAVHDLEKGAPETHVADQLGWTSTVQLKRYGKLRGASKETYRDLADMTVAEAKRARRAGFACPQCLKQYPDIREAADCYDRHRRGVSKPTKSQM